MRSLLLTAALLITGGRAFGQGGAPPSAAMAPALPPGMSEADARRAARNSGLTDAQIRARIVAAGYDASLADQYLNSGSGSGGAAESGSAATDAEFVEALTEAPAPRQLGDALTPGGVPAEAALRPAVPAQRTTARRTTAGSHTLFGKEFFEGEQSLFPAALGAPVDNAYRLNIGDQVQVVLTGDVERAYNLDVRRDGSVIAPQIGPVSLAGLTLDGARAALRQRAQQVYSGLGTGNTSLDLSVTRVRASQVFVIGEVEKPGAYQVSSLSTAFHALAQAGGPTSRGSFRRVELRRGGSTLQVLDLYDYLLRGDASHDLRIQQGDIIYVPLNTRTISVRGAVRREATFELLPGEGFDAFSQFFGGLLPDAATDRVQIDRILPPSERLPGRERVLIDVPVNGDLDALRRIPLHDGDIVTVFKISDRRRNYVEIAGEVLQPGTFEYRRGMRLSELVERAQGLLPWALKDRVQVVRQIAHTGRREFFDVDLARDGGTFALQEYDEVRVLDGRLLFPAGTVSVAGAVNRPGERGFLERQTLRGAIDGAGGFTESATVVEVARRHVAGEYSDTTSKVLTFTVDEIRNGSAGELALERDDRIFVRSSPGFREQRSVLLTGAFKNPGTFVLTSDGERVASVVRRAGGLLPTAYDHSFRVLRRGRLVPLDFTRAMQGDLRHDILLEAGDQLVIGTFEPTVLVRGAVQRSAMVRYDDKNDLDDYLRAAGGTTRIADTRRTMIESPSGEVQVASRVRKILPGSVITVPARVVDPNAKPGQTLQTVVQSTTAFMSLLVGLLAVTR